MHAAAAAALATTSWVVNLETWLQIGATAAAIAAAFTAAWYHVEKALAMRAERKEKQDDDDSTGDDG